MKFGGTSVGSAEAIAGVIEIVQAALAQGDQPVVVVSAMSKVTDKLVASINDAISGNRAAYTAAAHELAEKHRDALHKLMQPSAERDALQVEIDALLDDFVNLCSAVTIVGEATARIKDAVVAYGERLSSRIIAAAMRERGIDAVQYDAGHFLITDDHYGAASPLWNETQPRLDAELIPAVERGVVPIITGFIGQTLNGHITTLGRGGSDYSGAIFAAGTNSDELIIWTDVDGVMTTDPRIDQRARVLPYVSYEEVGELAFYGAKVLHPKTVQPILDRQIPLYVRNTFNPTHPGTLIGPESRPSATVIKAVTAVRSVSLLTVSGRGMMGVPGIAGRTFLAVARAGANILMISQASSEQNFCFVVLDDRAPFAKTAIEAELADEIARRDVSGVNIFPDAAIVTVVGAGMHGTPGVAGRVFTTMGDNGINVIAIAQGASECSISFVVSKSDLDRAVLALHELALEAVEA
jgi:aspartate kinase